MKTTVKVVGKAIILSLSLLLFGCAGPRDPYAEVIILSVGDGPICRIPPSLPRPYPDEELFQVPRYKPLPRPAGPADSPRTKTPAGDRPARKPVVVRGGSGSERPREQTVASQGKQPRRKR